MDRVKTEMHPNIDFRAWISNQFHIKPRDKLLIHQLKPSKAWMNIYSTQNTMDVITNPYLSLRCSNYVVMALCVSYIFVLSNNSPTCFISRVDFTWISNYIPTFMWDVITQPCQLRYQLSIVTSLAYRKVSNIRRTKSQNLYDSHLVLKSPLPNPLKPGVTSRMKM